MARETRACPMEFEIRAADTDPVLEGYASTFGQDYQVGPFREVVDPQAFDRSLSNKPDVRLLVDHDGQPLARTSSGTLELSTDSTGLHVRAPLDRSDPDVQRLLPKMRRGDLSQMSFAFRVPDGGDLWSRDLSMRTLRQVEINGGDVSVVTYPANPTTSVSVRSEDISDAEFVFAVRCFKQIHAQRSLPAATMEKLTSILQMVATADDNVDQAQADLADIIGIPNPDTDDPATPGQPVQSNAGRLLDLSRRKAVSLSL